MNPLGMAAANTPRSILFPVAKSSRLPDVECVRCAEPVGEWAWMGFASRTTDTGSMHMSPAFGAHFDCRDAVSAFMAATYPVDDGWQVSWHTAVWFFGHYATVTLAGTEQPFAVSPPAPPTPPLNDLTWQAHGRARSTNLDPLLDVAVARTITVTSRERFASIVLQRKAFLDHLDHARTNHEWHPIAAAAARDAATAGVAFVSEALGVLDATWQVAVHTVAMAMPGFAAKACAQALAAIELYGDITAMRTLTTDLITRTDRLTGGTTDAKDASACQTPQ